MRIEAIVVDDGSTDDTERVVRAFPDALYVRQENLGAAAARNHGLRRARGAWLAFLDADDLFTPGRLLAQWQAFQSEPALEMVMGQVETFRDGDDETPGGIGVANTHLSAGYLPSAVLMRRDCWDRVGPLDERLRFGDFIDWFARARRLAVRDRTLEMIVTRRRAHAGNLSRCDRSVYLDVVRQNLARARNRREAA